MAQNVAESNTQLSGGRNMPVDPASARSLSQSSNATSTLPRNEVQEEKPGKDRPKSVSFSSNGKTLHGTPGDGAVEQDCSAHPAVRTVPPWIRSMDEDDEDTSPTSRLLPTTPSNAFVAQHNHSPSAKRNPEPSRMHDRQREALPVTINPHSNENASRWATFAKTTAYPKVSTQGEKLVSNDWLTENLADYSQPWQANEQDDDAQDDSRYHAFRRKRTAWWKRLQHTILRNPIVPLVFRLTVWSFSLVALALGGSIHHLSIKYKHPQGPSALMAIIVDAVALVYILYITYDEYTGKPLGLRSAKAKIRLIFLDLFFIVFDSANLSLAFEALSAVTGSCTNAEVDARIDPRNNAICGRQMALASVLLIALIAWLMTFSISVLRLMERVVQI